MDQRIPLITNDAVVLGILVFILGFIFYTESKNTGFWSKFYSYVPALLLCYFIPSILNSLGVISGDQSKLYFVASNYLLPASLIYLTLSIDFKGLASLGSKAMIMFLTGTLGIMIGGPIAILIVLTFSPETVSGHGPDAVWRGLSTIAGSWIGGGANQTAMKEVFKVNDNLFAAVVAVDIIVANIWMAVLLYGAGRYKQIDGFLKADNSKIITLQKRVEEYQLANSKIPGLKHLVLIMAIGLGFTGVSHFLADIITPYLAQNYPGLEKFSLTSSFFWLILIATTIGMLLSFTRARQLEGYGTTKFGSLFIYILVATIGMKMDITAVVSNPGLFLVGIIWILVHGILLIIVAWIIKAPFFFVAVGSQANVGGAASAPIVAAAFHPSLAPVGVLLAVLGYALGTYGAYISALVMQAVAP
ncbi:MAG TPA: DUF819 family protein [Sphingobacteriaceae bacterium]